MVREVAHARKRNPLFDLNKILQGGRYPRHNHLGQFWWRSVKGLRSGGGSKFALLHWLIVVLTSLSRYHASVWCDASTCVCNINLKLIKCVFDYYHMITPMRNGCKRIFNGILWEMSELITQERITVRIFKLGGWMCDHWPRSKGQMSRSRGHVTYQQQ